MYQENDKFVWVWVPELPPLPSAAERAEMARYAKLSQTALDYLEAIRGEFAYVARQEAGVQEPLRTLRMGSGTCRDFAVLMIEALRSLGFAARFVSGYLHSPGALPTAYRGGGNTHAWVQVFLPGAGWIELDPTNGIVGNRDLIRVAVVRDPRQAVPLSGTWIGFPADSLGMQVEVNVTAEPEPAAVRPDSATAETVPPRADAA